MVSSMTSFKTCADEKAESRKIETTAASDVLRRMADSFAELLLLSRKLAGEARSPTLQDTHRRSAGSGSGFFSASVHPGSVVSPVISRAPRSYVRYDHAH